MIMLMMSLGCVGTMKVSSCKSSKSVVSHVGASTVALVHLEEGSVHPYCTGVWISDREILTANHCVESVARHLYGLEEEDEVDSVGVKINYIVESESRLTGVDHIGRVHSVDKAHDLALVIVDKLGIPVHEYSELSEELPGLGDSILCVGHPNGLYWSYVRGVVSSYRLGLPDMDIMGPFVQVSAPVWFGNSGGGVFDSGGKLVGIASFIVKVPNTAFYIHVDSIRKFIGK